MMKDIKAQTDRSESDTRADCDSSSLSSSAMTGHGNEHEHDDGKNARESLQGSEKRTYKAVLPSTRPRPGDRKRRANEMSSSSSPPIPASMEGGMNINADTGPRHHDGSHVQHSHLTFLGLSKSWVAAAKRAKTHPHEAQYGCTSSARTPLPLKHHNNSIMASSPLAIACRYGAPPETVKAILEADKNMVRRCIPNRGTPLHEAIMAYPRSSNSASGSIGTNGPNTRSSSTSDQYHDNDLHYVEIIRMLLEADEELESTRSTDNPCYDVNNPFQHDTLCTYDKRSTLIQDVDGNSPLHLLVRQAFYNYLGGMRERDNHLQETNENYGTMTQQQQHPLLTIINDLIKSSPEASAMPDCTEFEETPLILVLKSSIYATEQHNMIQQRANSSDASDKTTDLNYNAQLERRIFDVCKLMLQSHPFAASSVASKSGYTAVHSAVFHGRCCDTIRLLLSADSIYRESVKKRKINDFYKNYHLDHSFKLCSKGKISPCVNVPMPAALRANRFGECPLHFAAMRGECTRTIEMLSHAAPSATLKRDVKFGLTPLHWLVVRFVDTMYEQFGDRSFSCPDIKTNIVDDAASAFHADALSSISFDTDCGLDSTNGNSAVATRSDTNKTDDENDDQIQFDLEYHRRTVAIDPPVDYMRMRHILPEHTKLENILTNRVIHVLCRVRERHHRLMANMKRRQKEQKDMELMTKETVSPHHLKKNEETCESLILPRRLPVYAFPSGDKEEHTKRRRSRRQKMDTKERNHKYLPCDTKMENREGQLCPHSEKEREIERHTQRKSTSKVKGNGLVYKAIISDSKKCPFRCPFVFDSYPLDPALMGSEEETVREEQVISLFWAKVTSLLHAASVVQSLEDENDLIYDSATTVTSMKTKNETNARTSIDEERMFMLHSACSSPSPLAIVRLCLALYPEQLMVTDSRGQLPLHHAAARIWYIREFNTTKSKQKNQRRASSISSINNSDEVLVVRASFEISVGDNAQNDPSSNSGEILVPNIRAIPQSITSNLVENESSKALQLILSSSPVEASITLDAENRLPFHYAIDATVDALIQFQCLGNDGDDEKRHMSEPRLSVDDDESFDSVMNLYCSMIRVSSEIVEKLDGRTGLYPFLQIAAVATESIARCGDNARKGKASRYTLSLTYLVLLENPSVVGGLVPM